MPNAEQFAEWITGEREGLVTSDWRPSRLMLGEARWDGKTVTLEYTHANRKPLDVKCFVRGLVTQQSADAIPGKRRKPFPRDDDEALALTTLEFAGRGLTMVFVARKKSAEPFGRTVREAIKIRRRIAEAAGGSFGLPVSNRHRSDLTRCAVLAREHMGDDCDVATFLEEGFVVHHGSLPQAVRLELERLVRSGAVNLVIATTTLAQGVNFPIHTILIHSLDHGRGDFVSPMDFWNICGRAGRGMRENEGQVLFFSSEAFDEWCTSPSRKKWLKKLTSGRQRSAWERHCNQERARRAGYISAYGTYKVGSMLLDLVAKITGLWEEQHGSVDVPALCEAVANHTLDLFAPSQEIDIENLFSSLDGFLLAMVEGREDEEVTADTFQEILRRTLLHLQLPDDEHRRGVNELFAARISYVRAKHQDPGKRKQFYRLGLPLRDCEKIGEAQNELLALYLKAAGYEVWSVRERSAHLAEIATHLFRLSEITPSNPLPDPWEQILFLWLSGKTPTEIASDSEVAAGGVSARDVSRCLDDVCGYRLPWGYNVLALHLKDVAAAAGAQWPAVCDYYSAFAKYGVSQLVACWLLTFGVPSRKVAMRAAEAIDEEFEEPDKFVKWLQRGGLETLRERGLDEADVAMIETALTGFSRQYRAGNLQSSVIKAALITTANLSGALTSGDRLFLRRNSEVKSDGYRVYTLGGERVGRYSFSQRTDKLWELLEAPELLDCVVESVETHDSGVRVRLEVSSV